MADVIQIEKLDMKTMMNFNFVFDFQILKKTIESLIKNQMMLLDRVVELEKESDDKEYKLQKTDIRLDTIKETTEEIAIHIGEKDNDFKKKFDEIMKKLEEKENDRIRNIVINRKHLYVIGNRDKKKHKNKEKDNEKKQEDVDKNTDEENKDKKEENNINDIQNDNPETIKEEVTDENEESKENQSDEMNSKQQSEIADKLARIEYDIKEIKSKLKKKGILNKGSINNQDLDDQSYFKDKFKQLEEKFNILQKTNEEAISKISDFDIFELIRGGKGGESNGDPSFALIGVLEKKVFKKFELTDEKFKKNDEEIYKLKNDILNLRNQFEGLNNNLKTTKEEMLSNINKVSQESKDLLNNFFKNYKKDNDDKLDNVPGFSGVKMPDISQLLFMHDDKEKEEIEKDTTDNDKKATDVKIIKRISDVERMIRILSVTINPEALQKELARINQVLNDKMNKSEYLEIKELLGQQDNQINFLKDNLSQLLDDRKIFNDVNHLKKKLDMVYSSFQNNSRSSEEPSPSSHAKNPFVESVKYLDVLAFNEFTKHTKKEFEDFNNKYLELRNSIDDILPVLKNKTDMEELKSLEDFLIAKLEEFKIGNVKKFSDKIETTKNIRYLDAQIKHIMDVYIKKMEKGDNWLLAKKPMNGYTCASCEQYLGDLNDNSQYVPWNKIANDKIYRVGSGFSRMLQMLNLDVDKSEDLNSSKYRKETKMPRIHNHGNKGGKDAEGSMDLSFENNNMEGIGDTLDPNRAKVTKIYKMKKKDEK